jgi:hypothetical protein
LIICPVLRGVNRKCSKKRAGVDVHQYIAHIEDDVGWSMVCQRTRIPEQED